MKNPKIFPLSIGRSRNAAVYGGEEHLAIIEEPESGRGIIVADLETTPDAEAYANLFAAAPDLLQAAESAANAFEERISCLRDELREEFCDADDVRDQIGNYQWLLDRHRAVIARAKGRAA